MTNLSDIDKEDDRTIEVVLIFLIIGVIFCTIVEYLLPKLSLIQCFFAGFAVWSLIFFSVLLKYFCIFPGADYGVVLQNYLIKQYSGVSGDESNVNNIIIPKGQRSCTAGFVWKLPWELMVGDPIHLFKTRPISGTVRGQDMHGNMYDISWSVSLMPVPGKYLPRYQLVDDVAADQFFKGMFTSYILSEFKKQDGDIVVMDLSVFRDIFKGRFGGPDKIVDDERRQGRYTGEPVIESVVKDRPLAESEQAARIATNYASAIKTLVDAGVSPNIAPGIAMGQTPEMINISGSGQLPGVIPFNNQVGNQQNQGNRRRRKKKKGTI